jgi:hypothetical protein
LPPHVFAGVTNDMELAREEIFGPVRDEVFLVSKVLPQHATLHEPSKPARTA